jgi:hypothetical protein
MVLVAVFVPQSGVAEFQVVEGGGLSRAREQPA